MAELVTIKVKRETLIPLRVAIVKKYGILYGNLKKQIDIALKERTQKLLEDLEDEFCSSQVY